MTNRDLDKAGRGGLSCPDSSWLPGAVSNSGPLPVPPFLVTLPPRVHGVCQQQWCKLTLFLLTLILVTLLLQDPGLSHGFLWSPWFHHHQEPSVAVAAAAEARWVRKCCGFMVIWRWQALHTAEVQWGSEGHSGLPGPHSRGGVSPGKPLLFPQSDVLPLPLVPRRR